MDENNKEIVTIGLPVQSGLEEFKIAIKSIFSQTFQSWILIIFCDGASREIVKEALKIHDKRVIVHINEDNLGLPEALNKIANMTTTKYLVRMDADDVMHSERLSRQLQYLQAHPDIDVLATGSYLTDESLRVSGFYREPKLPDKRHNYLKSGIFCHPSVVMKTSWSISNPYDPQWIRTEDKELWLRTFSYSNFAKIEDRLMFIRVPKSLDKQKQKLTAKYNRKLIATKGGSVAPGFFCLWLISKSYAKQVIFWILISIGLSTLVHRSKCISLSEKEKVEAELELLKIYQSVIPGWQ